jgi:hypothetical protein
MSFRETAMRGALSAQSCRPVSISVVAGVGSSVIPRPYTRTRPETIPCYPVLPAAGDLIAEVFGGGDVAHQPPRTLEMDKQRQLCGHRPSGIGRFG